VKVPAGKNKVMKPTNVLEKVIDLPEANRNNESKDTTKHLSDSILSSRFADLCESYSNNSSPHQVGSNTRCFSFFYGGVTLKVF